MKFDWIKQRVIENPHTIFIRTEKREYSYSEVDEFANQYANQLILSGVEKNSKVAIFFDNPFDVVKSIIACLKVGAIFTPIKTKLKPRELEIAFKNLTPDFIITTKKMTRKTRPFEIQTILTEELQQSKNFKLVKINLEFDDVCAIIFTSGTTDTPKAVQLTYKNFYESAKSWSQILQFSSKDNYLICMPMEHIAGLSILIRALICGFSVTLADGFEVNTINQLLDNKIITLISLVPTMLQKLLDDRNGKPFPKILRTILLGGGRASNQLLEFCIDNNLPVYKTYGMTETTSGVSGFYLNKYPQKKQSVGLPFKNTDIKIIDDEIVISSPTVMKGYLNKSSCKRIYHSGDLGWFDKDGFLYLDTRRTDLIVTGGENVNPLEVEEIINTHPAIKSSKVVGVEDEKWGQKIIAYVVWDSEYIVRDSELLDWCKERLSNYKIPKQFVIDEQLQNKKG